MAVFPTIHADRIAPGSFQQPVPLPAALPGEPPLVTVCFNRDWLPYILGAFLQLTLSSTWLAASQADLDKALQRANDLILIFQEALPGCQTQNPGFAGSGDEFMLRQNPDNPCQLQTSVDGINWCTWADLSLCTGQPQQPGKGATNPPSGGCANFFGTVEFGSRWMLPNNVNTGDVIKVTNAVGTWASALDLFIPRCPDGNIFFEVGCISGTGHTEPGDPAPAINHDSLIAFDGTNYYDCGAASDGMTVTITIPAGISNANLFFFANTPDTSGFGAVNFDVQYCNNQVAAFTHTFDLTANPNGWTPLAFGGAAPSGVWTAGQGFNTSDVVQAGGAKFRRIYIERDFAATEIDSIQVTFNYVAGTFDNPAVDYGLLVGINTISDTHEIDHFASALSNGSGQVMVGAVPVPGATKMQVYLACTDTVPGAYAGSARVSKVVVTGKGADPF